MKNSKTFIDLGTPLFILLILLCTLSIFVSATDYCDPDLCAELGKNVVHTACNHTGEFHSRCLPPYYVIPISPSTKKLILHVHNDLRNKIANGTLPGFQSAVRMPTLLWDSELAYVVELHLKACLMGHDDCKNTNTFRYVGQNLGEELGDDIADNETESIVTKLTVQWFDEYVFAKQSDTDMCCDANRKGPAIGHFTQLIHQQVVRVGCATTRYDKVYNGVRLNTLYYGCNYSFANIIGAPIYDKGPAASACTTGVNPEFNALCSVYEEINQWLNFLDPQNVYLNKKRPIFSQFQPDSKAPTASNPAQTCNLMDALSKAKTIRRTKPMVKPWELTGADNQTRNEPPKIPVSTIHQKEPPISLVTIQHPPKSYNQITNLSSGADYCNPVLCEDNAMGQNHIGCRNSGKFLDTCDEPALVPLTPQLQKDILYMHNEMRNKVANGNLARFDSAIRMATMTWDQDLAYLAKLNVLQCQMKHDECHNTFEYRYSGQNLGLNAQSTKITEDDYEETIFHLINTWFDEHKNANQTDVDLYSFTGGPGEIGHFTSMIQEKSAKIGCACAQYRHHQSGRRWYALLLACNYSYTNMLGEPIYVKGPTASGCVSGRNREFTGLCSVSEKITPAPGDGEEEEIAKILQRHAIKLDQPSVRKPTPVHQMKQLYDSKPVQHMTREPTPFQRTPPTSGPNENALKNNFPIARQQIAPGRIPQNVVSAGSRAGQTTYPDEETRTPTSRNKQAAPYIAEEGAPSSMSRSKPPDWMAMSQNIRQPMARDRINETIRPVQTPALRERRDADPANELRHSFVIKELVQPEGRKEIIAQPAVSARNSGIIQQAPFSNLRGRRYFDPAPDPRQPPIKRDIVQFGGRTRVVEQQGPSIERRYFLFQRDSRTSNSSSLGQRFKNPSTEWHRLIEPRPINRDSEIIGHYPDGQEVQIANGNHWPFIGGIRF